MSTLQTILIRKQETNALRNWQVAYALKSPIDLPHHIVSNKFDDPVDLGFY